MPGRRRGGNRAHCNDAALGDRRPAEAGPADPATDMIGNVAMTKTTVTYWNPLQPEHRGRWTPVEGLAGLAEELTLSMDETTGEYTRLTRFHPGADTTPFGGKSHDYPEEVFIVSGRLYDAAFDTWLEAGHYASRPPGEVHGPFTTDTGCVVLELSFPGRPDGGR